MLGWRDRVSRYEIDLAESRIVHRMFTEWAAGKSIRSILIRLNEAGVPTPTGSGKWGTNTVTKILEGEFYATGQH